MDFIYRYDPYRPLSVDRPKDAESAVRTLLDGNQRVVKFVAQLQDALLGNAGPAETVAPIDLVSMGLPMVAGTSLDQHPFALVLGCSDARAPVEHIFDQAFNDLFVVRIAGNVLGTECVGSFDYAVRSFGRSLQLIAVLGHNGCGAVSAAVDGYLSPTDYGDIAFTHSLRSLVDRIMIAVRGAARGLEACCGHTIRNHPGYREALIEGAVYLNTAITAFDLAREAAHIGGGNLAVMYGVCDLRSVVVRSTPPRAIGKDLPTSSLGLAPKDPIAFGQLAREFAEEIAASGILA